MRELKKPETKKILTILAVILLAVGVIAVWQYALGDHSDTSRDDDSSLTTPESETQPQQDLPPAATDETRQGEDEKTETDEAPDPQLFSSIVITQMDIEVFYSKGIPGFSYKILRTPAGTQYVEFSSEDLIGTKCTGDEGVFASVIKNPSSAEESTVTATVKIDLDSYGLSLESDACTGDASLLTSYQSAFKNGFGSLRLAED